MRKIVTFILISITCLTLASPLASAKYTQPFNVKDYLRAGEGENQQEMDYFEQEPGSEISPAIDLLLKAIDIMVKVIGSLAILVLMIGGLILVTARGNEQQLTQGKDIMKYSIAGLAVALLSFIIITFVQSSLT